MKHFLEIDDLTGEELRLVLHQAGRPALGSVLDRRGAALVFEKPSARTRNSMEMAVVQLGGHPVTIRHDEVGLDVRESVEDVTRTLAGFHAIIAARVFDHRTLERMTAVSTVPIVNLLSDAAHPMQALADLLTLGQTFGDLAGRTLAWVGDANNVCRSLTVGSTMMGMNVRVCSPAGYGFTELQLERMAAAGATPVLCATPAEAVAGADAVSTDTWISMGQESEAGDRRHDFDGFTVDDSLMELAAADAIFLHCLPAHRGEEVSAEVIDGPRSRVWQQAQNRMHSARALLWFLLATDAERKPAQ